MVIHCSINQQKHSQLSLQLTGLFAYFKDISVHFVHSCTCLQPAVNACPFCHSLFSYEMKKHLSINKGSKQMNTDVCKIFGKVPRESTSIKVVIFPTDNPKGILPTRHLNDVHFKTHIRLLEQPLTTLPQGNPSPPNCTSRPFIYIQSPKFFRFSVLIAT